MNIEDAKKVIKNIKLESCKECVFGNDTGCINENGEDCQEIAIETLLTAYEKEKEKNKDAIDNNYISKDKIKARIEELDDLNSPFAQRVIKGEEVYLTEMVQNILQSFLEKE